MEQTQEQAHQEYLAEAKEDHRHAKAMIQDLRAAGLLSEADKAQRAYKLTIDLGFISMFGRAGLYCEYRSTLRPPVLKQDCPVCQGEI